MEKRTKNIQTNRGDGAEGSCVGVVGDGTEGSTAVAKSVGEARPLVVLRAVERLLDMEHEPALRVLESLRKRIVEVEKEGNLS